MFALILRTGLDAFRLTITSEHNSIECCSAVAGLSLIGMLLRHRALLLLLFRYA